jgi:hypothetical protein
MASIVIAGDTSGTVTLAAPLVAGTTTLTLPTTDGTVVVSGTTPTLNGITFPATAVPSANANTLDDYEEGTWTPTVFFGGSTSGVTYGVQGGTYTKIGRMVYCQAVFSLTNNGSGTGDATIRGLPFTVGDVLPNTSLESGGMMTYFANSGVSVSGFSIIPIESSTEALIFYMPASSTANGAATDSYLSNTFDCRMFFTYNT